MRTEIKRLLFNILSRITLANGLNFSVHIENLFKLYRKVKDNK